MDLYGDGMKVSTVDFGLNEFDFEKIFLQWNKTDRAYPKDKTIHQLFEEQVKKTPDNIALMFGSEILTYSQLNKRANQLAIQLRREYKCKTTNNLQPNTLIALCLEKSLEMVISVLAVLKAGGAYVPIEPNYPQERLKFILDDIDAKIIISHKRLINILPSNVKCVISDLDSEYYHSNSEHNLEPYASAQDLAYVIYTSGTTGRPKGVMIPHRGIVNRLTWMQEEYPLSEQDVVLQKTPYVFDVSVWELFWAHWYGARLVMVKPEGHKDSRYLYQLINQEKVTTLHFVPSMLDAYNEYLTANNLKFNNTIKTIFCSGEALQSITVNQTYSKSNNQNFRLHNLYGPTEASIDVTYYATESGQNVYIGRPIANTRAYILDANKRPVAIGAVGELYLGGAGLALGYLNREELTAERFVENYFATDSDIKNGYTKLYKTGDLAQWTEEGNIAYRGRNDDQVKIRGYRIELGEIESKLREVTGIQQACVLAKTRNTDMGSSKYLVAYYSVRPDHSTTKEKIFSALSKYLPEYMVPTILVEVENFPLTVNGKLDKKALPEPKLISTNIYSEPRNDLELKICSLWEKVLGVERVGITDSFFRIGGDSILAIVLAAKMGELLDFELNVADVFKYKDIKTILDESPKKGKIIIPKLELEQSTLSFAQEQLWFVEQYEQGTTAYHIPCLYKLNLAVNIQLVKKAIQAVVARHAILRTTIEKIDTHDIQRIHSEPLDIKERQLTGENYNEIISQEINTPFNLQDEYPIRVTLYQLSNDESDHLLLVNFHHIATDGWSIDVFERDFQSYYHAFSNKQEPGLPTLSIQYMDYAVWQRAYLQESINQEQVSYWKAKLAGYQTLELQTDYPRPSKVSYQGKHQCFSIDIETSRALRTLAKQSNCTLHTVTLSLFSLLLGKYCNQTDIVTGTPIANRHYAQTQDLIGLFINVQVNRIEIDPAQTFKELIQQVQQDQVEAQIHQDIPFERLMEVLNVERDITRHPIFQIMFGVQGFGEIDYNNEWRHSNPLVPYTGLSDIYEYVRFDMEFFIDDRQEELQGIIRYADKLFKAETIKQIIEHYKYLAEQVVMSGNVQIEALSVLSRDEIKKLTLDWNKTDKDFPKDKTIHQLFEEQVIRSPDATAVTIEETSLTYRELNEKANRLARKIRAEYQQRVGKVLQPDTLVALYLDRSLEMLVAVLAVLKAGAAYVPIDPGYPLERSRFMLEDSQAELILTLKNIIYQQSEPEGINLLLQAYNQNRWLAVDLDEPFYQQMQGNNLETFANADNLAYVIYTSGTTGKPKGVMLAHRGVVNRIMWMQSKYPLSSSDVVLQKTPYVFDVSVWELFWAHWYGAELVLAKPNGHKDSDYLNNLIINKKITTLHFVPSMLEAYNGYLQFNQCKLPSTIKQMFCSGEALYETTVNQTYDIAQNPKFKLHNLYGPTEASIDVTYYETQKGKAVLIGKPIDNIRTYILDDNKQPVPIGVVGELYLGGVGLAKGYLNRDELTAERFVENTFATEKDLQNGYTKLYKTGDLVRWLPDGNIAYLGRNDDQVKVRGYRIELDEIANKLRGIPGVNQACVLVKKRKINNSSVSQYLVAYYTESQNGLVNEKYLLNELAKELPDYMLPGAFVRMDAFPLTINGKLDKRLLPEPVLNNSNDFVAPRDSMESDLCDIWQEALGLDQVGVTDNFFRMGGHSILAIKVVYLSAQKGYHLGVVNLFLTPTIEKLADFLRNNNGTMISNVIPKDYQPLSLVDRGQLSDEYLSQFEDIYPVSYTQLGIISENLKNECLIHTDNFHFKVFHTYSPKKIRSSVSDLLKRHELLRSVINSHPEYDFLVCNKKYYQVEDYIYEHRVSHAEYRDFDGEAFGHARFVNDPMINDMGQTLFQLHVVTCEQDPSSFILVGLFNHVIADGWSLNLFSSQFMSLYLSAADKPIFGSSMKYAEFVANEQACVANQENKTFWLNYIGNYERKDDLFLRSGIELNTPDVIPPSAKIDATLIKRAYRLCEKLQINIDIIFMAATYTLVSRYMGVDDVAIGYVQNNRPEKIGSENTFGYFLNLVPFRVNYQGNGSLALLETINSLKSEILKYKLYPYPLMQKELGVGGTIFNVAFNYISFKSIDEYAGKDIDVYMNTGLENIPAYVEVRDMNGEFNIQLNFKEGSVDAYYRQLLTEYYLFYLEAIINEQEIVNVQPADLDKMLSSWNRTEADYPKDKTLQDLFERQVGQTPDSIALVFEDETLTYQELNERANQLAHAIRARYRAEHGADPQADTLIALYQDRSLEMVIGILAILKAGAAYVPISPDYPKERACFILEDIKALLVLTQHSYLSRLNDWAVELDIKPALLAADNDANVAFQPLANPEPICQSTDLAYVIYTSGTTGKPKGVMVEHTAVASFVLNNNYLDAKNVSVVASLSPHVFDGFIFDLFYPLLNGKSVVLFSKEDVLELPEFLSKLSHYNVDSLFITTALFGTLIANGNLQGSSLRNILFGGEKADVKLISASINQHPELTFTHVYGPTECVVYATSCRLSPNTTEVLSIGKALQGKRLYVLSSTNTPVPIGVPGELYIGGVGLARGYLNRPDLTSERFIDNPFASEADIENGYTRLYKTGDLVRWLPDGNVEYLGRNDFQVKINGYRIELGEIESALTALAGVKQAIVIDRTDEGKKYLAAYVLMHDEASFDAAALRNVLSGTLPEYMLPATLTQIDAVPLTINGKLDRRALPKPAFVTIDSYTAPRNQQERKVCAIWQEVLGLQRVGINDDFFKIGGESITAVKLSIRMTAELNSKISVANIFSYKNISSLLEKLSAESQYITYGEL